MGEDRTCTPAPGRAADPPSVPPTNPPGYELLDELGHGGMGVVYCARDVALERDVAVKLLSERYAADSLAAQRFLSEARINGQLQHPGIPAVHQVGILADGRPFLAMKLIKGSTLEAILKHRADPAADRGRLLTIFEAVCQAVGYAHAHRVIHRDLKPANVMVGAFAEVQVMDWGLAKVLGEEKPATAETQAAEQTRAWTQVSPTMEAGSHTQAGTLIGTPAFIPPEQAIGQLERVNERSDVFGLGALLAVILTGQPPYVGETAEAVRVQAVRGQLEDCFARLDASGAEPELLALCKKCLAFEPADRPADAGAVAQAVAGLRAAADERARRAELERVRLEGEQATAAARRAERGKRWRLMLGAAAVLVVAAVGGLTAVLTVQRQANADLAAKNAELKGEQAKVEEARTTAVTKAADATAARRTLALTLADSYTTLGLAAGERNDPAAAALWFARAVRQSKGDPEREFHNRVRYRNWAGETFTPVAALQLTPPVSELAIHPGGRYLATCSVAYHSVWNLDREAPWVGPTGFDKLTALAWNADGSRIALAVDDKGAAARVGVFEFPSGKVVRQRKKAGFVSVVRFSPDGRTLAIGGREVDVWNPDDDQLTTPALPHPSPVLTIDFAPDGKRLATQAGGKARVFDLVGPTAAKAVLVTPHINDVTSGLSQTRMPQFADGGRVLVTCPSESLVRGLDVATGKPRFEHRPRNGTFAVTVSPDGQTVWVGQGQNGRGVDVIAVADGSVRPFTLPHTNMVASIVCTTDGRTVVTGSWDRTLSVWDTATGRRRFPPLTHSELVRRVACTPDSRTIASAQWDGLVVVWRLPTGVPVRTIDPGGEYTLTRFAANGRYIVPTCGTGGFPEATLTRLQLYDPATGAPAAPAVTPGGLVLDADVSPDGRLLVTGSASRANGGEKPGEPLPRPTIRVWDVKSGRPVGEPINAPSEPRSVRFLPNRGEVAVLCAGGQVALLDPDGPRVKRTITEPEMVFQANQYVINGRLRYTPQDRRILIFGPSFASFWVCDPEAGTLSPIRRKNHYGAYDVTPSPDGRVWARSSQQKTTEFFAADGGPAPARPLVHPDWTFSARFNRAGDRLLSASRDGVARLWDWRAGKLLVACRHADEVPQAEFLPDERFLVTVSQDGTLRVWGAATGEPVAPPVPLGGKGLTLDVTPDGRFAVASGFSKHITVADLVGLTTPTRGDADELDLRAELASNQRITPSGGLTYLSTEEWLTRWRAQRRRNAGEKGHTRE
jgi:WD40 repeat protein